MRTVGFSNILRAADMAAQFGIRLVPHNWQSEVGKLMSIHASKIRKNITFVEDDRYKNFAINAGAFTFKNGQWFIPEKPGWGFELNPEYDRFAKETKEIVIQ